MQANEHGRLEVGAGAVLTFLIADVRGYTAFTQDHGDEALEALQTGTQIAHAAGDTALELRLLDRIGWGHRSRGSGHEGLRRIQAALSSVPSTPELEEQLAELQVTIARLYFGTDQFQDQMDAATRASAMARSLGNNRLLAASEAVRGSALGYQGAIAAACDVLEEVGRVAEAAGDLWVLSLALNNLAAMNGFNDKVESGRERIYRLIQLAEQLADPVDLGFQYSNLSVDLYEAGEWEDAVSYAERSVSLLDSVGAQWHRPYPRAHLGMIRFGQGQLDEGYRLMSEALALAERNNDLQLLGLICLHASYADLQRGDTDTALSRLGQFRQISEGSGMTLTDALVLPMEGWAHLLLRDAAEAERLARAGLAAARDAGWVQIEPESYMVLGMALRDQHKWDKAASVFEEGLALVKHMKVPYDEARLLHEYGVMHARRRDAASAAHLLEQARDIFARLGARAYLESVENDLRSLY